MLRVACTEEHQMLGHASPSGFVCNLYLLQWDRQVKKNRVFWAMGEEIDMRWGCSCGYSRMNFTRHKIHCRRRDQVGQNLLFGNLLFGDVKSVTSLLAPATAAPHPLLPAFCKIEEEKNYYKALNIPSYFWSINLGSSGSILKNTYKCIAK